MPSGILLLLFTYTVL